jgi:hypothetical protein
MGRRWEMAEMLSEVVDVEGKRRFERRAGF